MLVAENRELAGENASLVEKLESMEACFEESKGIDAKGDVVSTDKEQWTESRDGKSSVCKARSLKGQLG